MFTMTNKKGKIGNNLCIFQIVLKNMAQRGDSKAHKSNKINKTHGKTGRS